MYPFQRFSERAKKALTLAQDEAERSHHSYIGTEHLLLGLLREGEGLAAKLLANLGVEIDEVRDAIDSVLGGNGRIIVQQIIPTSRVKQVIEIAFEETDRSGDAWVGTQHLLLGLLIEGEGIAAHVLEEFGVTAESVRGRLPELLQAQGPEPAQAPTTERPRAGSRVEARFGAPVPGPGGPWPLGQLSSPARTVLAIAEEEAVGAGREQVGTDHLLLGLSRQGEGLAARVLAELGIGLVQLRRELGSQPGPPGEERGTEIGPSQPLLELVTVAAAREADQDRSRLIGTQHLLLALVSRPGEEAARVLSRLGADEPSVRARLRRLGPGAFPDE